MKNLVLSVVNVWKSCLFIKRDVLFVQIVELLNANNLQYYSLDTYKGVLITWPVLL